LAFQVALKIEEKVKQTSISFQEEKKSEQLDIELKAHAP